MPGQFRFKCECRDRALRGDCALLLNTPCAMLANLVSALLVSLPPQPAKMTDRSVLSAASPLPARSLNVAVSRFCPAQRLTRILYIVLGSLCENFRKSRPGRRKTIVSTRDRLWRHARLAKQIVAPKTLTLAHFGNFMLEGDIDYSGISGFGGQIHHHCGVLIRPRAVTELKDGAWSLSEEQTPHVSAPVNSFR